MGQDRVGFEKYYAEDGFSVKEEFVFIWTPQGHEPKIFRTEDDDEARQFMVGYYATQGLSGDSSERMAGNLLKAVRDKWYDERKVPNFLRPTDEEILSEYRQVVLV